MSDVQRQQRRRKDRATAKEEQQAATEEQMAKRQSLLEALETVPGRISSPAAKLNPYSPYVFRLIQKTIRAIPVIQVLQDILRSHPGVPSKLHIGSMFHGAFTANWEKHTFERAAIATALTRMSKDFKEELELPDRLSYPTFWKQQKRLEDYLRATSNLEDFSGPLNWLEHESLAASVSHLDADEIEVVAVDETPFLSWNIPENYDVQAEVNKLVRKRYRELAGLGPRASVPKMSSPEMRTVAAEMGFTLGEDGRLARTSKDWDVRAMHVSATSKDSSKLRSGFASTKVVAVAGFTVSRNSDKLTAKKPVASFVLASHTYPGNTDCAPIGAEMLKRARKIAKNATAVLVDMGFSDKEENFVIPALDLGFDVHRQYHSDYVHTHRPAVVEHSAGNDCVIESCGQIYHHWMPERLRDVPWGMSGEELANFQAGRQKWAYDRETDKSLPKGAFRYRCPVERGKIYNEALPSSVISRRANARRVKVPEGETQCCNQCSFVDRDHRFVKYQYPHYGTLAHQALMPKRNPVEGKFGVIKNKYGLVSTSCRAKQNEAHVLSSIVIDVVHNLQSKLNLEIEELLAHQKAKRARKHAAAAQRDQQAPNDGREMAESDDRDSPDEEAPEDSDEEPSAETPTPPRAPP